MTTAGRRVTTPIEVVPTLGAAAPARGARHPDRARHVRLPRLRGARARPRSSPPRRPRRPRRRAAHSGADRPATGTRPQPAPAPQPLPQTGPRRCRHRRPSHAVERRAAAVSQPPADQARPPVAPAAKPPAPAAPPALAVRPLGPVRARDAGASRSRRPRCSSSAARARVRGRQRRRGLRAPAFAAAVGDARRRRGARPGDRGRNADRPCPPALARTGVRRSDGH